MIAGAPLMKTCARLAASWPPSPLVKLTAKIAVPIEHRVAWERERAVTGLAEGAPVAAAGQGPNRLG